MITDDDLYKAYHPDIAELREHAKIKKNGDIYTINCKRGLWGVSGKYGADLFNNALYYYHQYKQDGEYN